MPSPARKLLIAGRGGLNLTHSEPLDVFLTRYGDAAAWLAPAIRAFDPEALQHWCEGLGEPVFVGSSGRVFPRSMKAVALLRAWLKRLEALGVRYHPRHTWAGWQGRALRFETPDGTKIITADATLLALGGASWPRLGSDGGWVGILRAENIPLAPLAPANCGFYDRLVRLFSRAFRRAAAQATCHYACGHHPSGRGNDILARHRGRRHLCPVGSHSQMPLRATGKRPSPSTFAPSMTVDSLHTKLGTRGNKSLSFVFAQQQFLAAGDCIAARNRT